MKVQRRHSLDGVLIRNKKLLEGLLASLLGAPGRTTRNKKLRTEQGRDYSS